MKLSKQTRWATVVVFFFFLSPQFANALELKVNLLIFNKDTNQTQRTNGIIIVDGGTDIVSKFRLVTIGRALICGGTRKILVARQNFLSGTFSGKCFGFRAKGKWSQTGQIVKFRWNYKGSWIETR